jgi:DNA-binding response OmpR family regulator
LVEFAPRSEQEFVTLFGLASVLQRQGFSTLEAGTGAEAIKKAIAEKPDVIMLDLELI